MSLIYISGLTLFVRERRKEEDPLHVWLGLLVFLVYTTNLRVTQELLFLRLKCSRPPRVWSLPESTEYLSNNCALSDLGCASQRLGHIHPPRPHTHRFLHVKTVQGSTPTTWRVWNTWSPPVAFSPTPSLLRFDSLLFSLYLSLDLRKSSLKEVYGLWKKEYWVGDHQRGKGVKKIRFDHERFE